MLLGVVGHVVDLDEAYLVVKRLVGALPSGGYLVLAGGTVTDADARATTEDGDYGYGYRNRAREQIAQFFDGLDLVSPGLVSVPFWRPHPGQNPVPLESLCAVGRVP